MSGKLYFVSTPIGNLKDFSFRAVETLQSVDEILCEDTRTSLKLLNHYDIRKPLFSFHKFNYKTAIPTVIEKLKEGKNLALISDAGMPCISDPGSELIPFLIENEIDYTIIPGACAFVSAVALSGISAPFTFVGFLPDNKKEERKVLDKFKDHICPIVLYVAPHKLVSTMQSIYKIFGNRKCISVRELTKMYEEVEFFSLEEGYPKEPKGEYVLIVQNNLEQENELNKLSIEKHYEHYVNQGLTKSDAIKQVAKDRNVPKNEIYKIICC